MQLDLVIDGAEIVTMDPACPRATSVGIWQGRIAGFDGDIDQMRCRRRVDVCGATVLPAFLDPHVHLTWAGLSAAAIDLAGAASVEEVVGRISASLPAGDTWVEASGYDQRPLGRHLSRDDLDRAAPGRRALVRHRSGHLVVVSSATLDLIGDAALRAAGANVDRDETGRPTGLLLEEALSLAMAQRMPYSTAEIRAALEHSARRCAAQGITFCAEAGIGAGLTAHSPVELAAYQEAVEHGLPLRVQTMVVGDALRAVPGSGLALDLGMRTGMGGDRLSIGAIKLWLDGGMMARTAALSEPYVQLRAGEVTTSGQLTGDVESHRAVVSAAHRAGWQVALHAIGDRAVDLALELISDAQAAFPRAGARHRIEHCGLVRPDQLERMARAGVTAVVQPEFLAHFGDDYAAVMGEERAPWLYRGRSFLDHGVALAGSSDRPVTDGNPFTAIQFMVTRRTSSGTVVGPDEGISVEQAIHAYTVGAARACRVERKLGSLTPGSLADLIVLERDPFATPADELASITVGTTVLGGDVVHDAAGHTA